MTIPFLDLVAGYRELKADIDVAVQRVLASGNYILGPEVEAFEAEWATYCGVEHSVGVASGLDALVLALRAVDVGPGDEVIVPSNTFIATWLAVAAVGAKPVPVEPEPASYNIDPERVKAAITPATKALVPVHLYGLPADLDPLLEVARSHGLCVVEDAAQAHGAKYRGRRIGGHGDIAAWSFYPGKNLGAFGDGGAVTTNSDAIAAKVRLLRNYGSRERYLNEVRGVNSRLDPIQAAILRAKLPHLEAWTERRREVAEIYNRGLIDTGLILPHVPAWADPVWHLYVVRVEERDSLQERLLASGIQTLIHYPVPPHQQRAFADTDAARFHLPLAARFATQVLSLPIGPHLDVESAKRVVAAIKSIA